MLREPSRFVNATSQGNLKHKQSPQVEVDLPSLGKVFLGAWLDRGATLWPHQAPWLSQRRLLVVWDVESICDIGSGFGP